MNTKRFEKRATEFKNPSLNQSFDKNKLNFTKIDNNEVNYKISS